MPSLFVSELPSVRLGGALSSGARGDFGLWTGSQAASPDFLPYPYLGSESCPWPPTTPEVCNYSRNSQLLPSPTLSFQTKPVKTDLRWQLWPHLATARVHGPPAGFESQTLSTPDVHEAWTDTVFEAHQERSAENSWMRCFSLAPSKPNGAEYLHPSLSFLLQTQAHSSATVQ